MTRPAPGEGLLRALGFTLAGFVLGALAGAATGMADMVLNPSRGAPRGEEECALVIQETALAAGLVGLPIGLFVALPRRG